MTTGQDYKQFGVRVPVDLHKRLKLEAVRRGATMAELVEDAVERILAVDEGEVAEGGPPAIKGLTAGIRGLREARKHLARHDADQVGSLVGSLVRIRDELRSKARGAP